MKYILTEEEEDSEASKYNAGSKARKDAEKIVLEYGFSPLQVKCKKVPEEKWKILQRRFRFFLNNRLLQKKMRALQPGDYFFVQYPHSVYTNFNAKMAKKLKKRGIHVIFLIHDINFLRDKNSKTLRGISKRLHEKQLLNQANILISHNERMTNVLRETLPNQSGIKIVNLKLFDYLTKTKSVSSLSLQKCVAIAGNISPVKAGYLSSLHQIPNIHFDLYGAGYDAKEAQKNVSFVGCFSPDEVANKIKDSFGLVWDGDSISACSGHNGNYLRFNNPHKASLYLAAGIPIIVWNKSALAPIVEQNKLGLVTSSLEDMQRQISELTEQNYLLIRSNVSSYQTKICAGAFLKEALDSIFR